MLEQTGELKGILTAKIRLHTSGVLRHMLKRII
jgi:hypothetical protein